jgi:hypothetical protein
MPNFVYTENLETGLRQMIQLRKHTVFRFLHPYIELRARSESAQL